MLQENHAEPHDKYKSFTLSIQCLFHNFQLKKSLTIFSKGLDMKYKVRTPSTGNIRHLVFVFSCPPPPPSLPPYTFINTADHRELSEPQCGWIPTKSWTDQRLVRIEATCELELSFFVRLFLSQPFFHLLVGDMLHPYASKVSCSWKRKFMLWC